ncbi:MAG: polysaccharide biosynthesis protein [Bacteroidetes bacterium]|nr:polysaccharide biosynthesis protein [Bacteroidota bacterium]
MKYLIKRLSRHALLMFIDFVLLLGSWELAFYVNGSHFYIYGNSISALLILAIIIFQVLMFWAVKLYRISLRSVSLELVYKGGLAMVIGNLFALLVVFTQFDAFNALQLLIPYWAISLLTVFSYRIIWRMTHGYNITLTNHVMLSRTLIYGAGEVGEQLLRLYRKDRLEYKVIGLIDDNQLKHSTLVHGLPVLGTVLQLEEIVKHENIKTIIIATIKIAQDNLDKVLDVSARLDLDVKIIPSLFEVDNYSRSITDIRDIKVEDLLGRDPVVIEREPILELVRDKTILVTGAGGSIGNEISSQLLLFHPKRLIILDIDETEIHDLSLRLNNYERAFCELIIPVICDVRDREKINQIMSTYAPDIVFHAAAYKHVPLMEHFPEEAFRTNIIGTYNVLTAAVAAETKKCIIISTDKAVNPTNVMGATKRMAEQIGSTLSNEKTEIVSVRFGNVLGSRGSMLPLFMEQINKGLPVTVTHKDIIRYFMTIPEAVSLVFLAGAIGKGGQVLVLDMGEPVKIYDFAQKLIKRFGDGRSQVKITGLRPGEKLYEELLAAEDNSIPTDYKKIYLAKVNGEIDKGIIEEVVNSDKGMSRVEVVEVLKRCVGGYGPE